MFTTYSATTTAPVCLLPFSSTYANLSKLICLAYFRYCYCLIICSLTHGVKLCIPSVGTGR